MDKQNQFDTWFDWKQNQFDIWFDWKEVDELPNKVVCLCRYLSPIQYDMMSVCMVTEECAQ